MFAALVMLAAVTVTLKLSHFSSLSGANFDYKSETLAAAESGIDWALVSLASASSPLAPDPKDPAIVRSADFEFGGQRVNIELHPNETGGYQLLSTARSSGGQISTTVRAVIIAEPDQRGRIYAQFGGKGSADKTIYTRESGDWAPVPPPPDATIPNPEQGKAQNVSSLVGDETGGLFAIDKHKDADDFLWHYQNNSWKQQAPPKDAKNLTQLAYGGGQLFLTSKGVSDETDTVWNLRNDSWSPLPPVPGAGEIAELCTDKTGMVVCIRQGEIFQSKPDAKGNYAGWSKLAMPLDSKGAIPQLEEIDLSPNGVLYAAEKKGSKHDIYKFQDGRWKLVSRESADLDNIAVDSQGSLVGKYNPPSGSDGLKSYDSRKKKWNELSAPKQFVKYRSSQDTKPEEEFLADYKVSDLTRGTEILASRSYRRVLTYVR